MYNTAQGQLFFFLLSSGGECTNTQKATVDLWTYRALVHYTSCTLYRITFIATSGGGLVFTHELTVRIGGGEIESETSFLRTT